MPMGIFGDDFCKQLSWNIILYLINFNMNLHWLHEFSLYFIQKWVAFQWKCIGGKQKVLYSFTYFLDLTESHSFYSLSTRTHSMNKSLSHIEIYPFQITVF